MVQLNRARNSRGTIDNSRRESGGRYGGGDDIYGGRGSGDVDVSVCSGLEGRAISD